MGTPQFAVPSLERIAAGPHRVVTVVTQPDRPAGRGQKLRESPVKRSAITFGIPVLQPAKVRSGELADALRKLAPDLGVVVAYGRILPTDVLAIPRLGTINAHASLLPHLRGAAPIQRALMAGDRESGVTIMQIDEQMDAGDVLLARAIKIASDDDAASLGAKLAATAAELLAVALDRLAAGELRATPQNHAGATYAPPLQRAESAIDWSLPADAIERCVRALRPEPGAFTLHDGLRLKVLRATLAKSTEVAAPGTVTVGVDGDVTVACGRDAIRIVEVQPEGGRPMSAIDYFRGKGAARRRVLGDRAGTR